MHCDKVETKHRKLTMNDAQVMNLQTKALKAKTEIERIEELLTGHMESSELR